MHMLIQYLKCVLDALQFVVEVKILIECTIRQNKLLMLLGTVRILAIVYSLN